MLYGSGHTKIYALLKLKKEQLAKLWLGKSTAVSITKEFCQGQLGPHFIRFPSSRRETAEAILKLREKEKCVLPQAIGAFDGTHLTLTVLDSKGDYFNRENKVIL